MGSVGNKLPPNTLCRVTSGQLAGTNVITKTPVNAGFRGIEWSVVDANQPSRRYYSISEKSLIELGRLCPECQERPLDLERNDVEMCRQCRIEDVRFAVKDRVRQYEQGEGGLVGLLEIMMHHDIPPQQVLAWARDEWPEVF